MPQKLAAFVVKENAGELLKMNELVAAGKVTPVLGPAFSLANGAAAVAAFETGRRSRTHRDLDLTEYLIAFNDEWVPGLTLEELRERARRQNRDRGDEVRRRQVRRRAVMGLVGAAQVISK